MWIWIWLLLVVINKVCMLNLLFLPVSTCTLYNASHYASYIHLFIHWASAWFPSDLLKAFVCITQKTGRVHNGINYLQNRSIFWHFAGKSCLGVCYLVPQIQILTQARLPATVRPHASPYFLREEQRLDTAE